MRGIVLRWMAVVAVAVCPVSGQGAEEEQQRDDREESWGSYVESAQREFSADIVETGRWLDSVFGSGVFDSDPEGSVLRLGFSTELQSGGMELSPEVRVQLELPRTEKRFNFYLENTVEDAFTENDDSPIGVAEAIDPDRSTRRDDDFIAGFEYFDEWADFLNYRATAGIVVQWPLNPFSRMRVRRSFFLGGWQARFGETVFWSHDRGLGAETEMVWQHPMSEDYFFRSDTEATYLEREDAFLYSHEFLITRRIAPREALLYRWAFYSRSDEGTPFTNVVYDLRWRRPLYKDWVLMELRPGFEFRQEDDFEAHPRVFLTVEALFGDRGEFEY